jgi:arylsulfatase
MTSDINVVFIIIDALRAGNLSCYGYPKQTTPNIDDLAKKGVLFENAFSCTNVTDSSLTSIFSGKYPINHGIVSHGMKLQEEQLRKISTISFFHEILKQHGYVTMAVDWLKRWHKRNYDVYYDLYHGQQDPHGIQEKRTTKFKVLKAVADTLRFFKMNKIYRKGKSTLKYGREATTVSDVAAKLIEQNLNRKFFIFLHYWDTHSMYNPPKSYTEKFYQSKENSGRQSIEEMLNQIQNEGRRNYLRQHLRNIPSLDYVVAQYNGAIAYADHEVGRIMNLIEDRNISENTLVIVTSDHGESLTEHGIFFDHHGLYDVSIHVPLIMKGPGLRKGKRIRELIQHVDLLPSMLDILKIPISDEKTFDGVSLMPLINGEVNEVHPAIFVEEAYYERKRAVRTTKYKYIKALSKEGAMCRCCHRIHGGLEELYDLTKDPQETQNIVKREPEIRNTLKKTLSTWVKSFEHVQAEKKSEEQYARSSEEEKEVM